MQPFNFELVLWAVGSILYVTLLALLVGKRMCGARPLFFAWVATTFLSSTLLFLLSLSSAPHSYATYFWLSALLDIGLEVAVLFEFARKAFYDRHWLAESKLLCSAGIATSIPVSVLFAYYVQPAAPDEHSSFFVHIELFSTLLPFLLALSIIAIAARVGSFWERIDSKLFLGYLMWSATAAITDSMHAYWRTTAYFEYLNIVQTCSTFGMILWWIVSVVQSKDNQPIFEPEKIRQLKSLLGNISR